MHSALALAAGLLAASPVVAAEPQGGLFSALTVTSDSRFQGVSRSDNGPAMQGYVHWWRPDGWYTGAFASTVRFKGAVGASFETDTYAGRNLDLQGGKTRLTGELMYSAFPDNRTPGPIFDFLQLKLAAQRKAGPFTFKTAVSYTPQASYGTGPTWVVDTEATRAISSNFALEARVGHRWVPQGADRTFWSLGGAWTRKNLTFELRYEGTDLTRRECGYNPDVCGGAVVAAQTAALPPLMFSAGRR